jgi:hypothetical protein
VPRPNVGFTGLTSFSERFNFIFFLLLFLIIK